MLFAFALLLAQENDLDGPEKLDAPVRDVSLKDLLKPGDPPVPLSSWRDKKAVVLVFTSYSCDACLVYEARIRALIKDFGGKDVVFLAVRSSAEDTAEGMRTYAKQAAFDIPFLDDVGNKVADRYGVRVTPSFRLIDKKGVLRYRGALDDSLQEDGAKAPHLRRALEAVLAGDPVNVKESRAVGCAMPRVQDEGR
jgi:peroxiredoxin